MRRFHTRSLSAFSTLVLLSALSSFGASSDSRTSNEDRDRPEWQHRQAESRHSFALGICVGQTLSQQGINVPTVQVDQQGMLDSTTRAALKTAIETCRVEMEGPGPVTPTSTPHPSPTPTSVSSAPSPSAVAPTVVVPSAPDTAASGNG